ncbi:MAG: hypothetical protein IPK17_00655, partial [Chloroflexi bacterium]|nr:hypothetical protein [Chloroflexota bacterium]
MLPSRQHGAFGDGGIFAQQADDDRFGVTIDFGPCRNSSVWKASAWVSDISFILSMASQA